MSYASNDRQALDRMLERTGRAYTRSNKAITLSIESGRDYVFTFGADDNLQSTSLTTPEGRGLQGFSTTVDFNDFNFGPLTLEALTEILPGANNEQHLGDEGKAFIVGVPLSQDSSCLRINYIEGDFGEDSGVKWSLPLPKSNEYYYEYNICFGKDFDTVFKGHLPGLGGGAISDQTSWDTGFAWKINSRLAYRYDTSTISIRDEIGDFLILTPGVWIRFQCRVKLNTPGNSDGILQVWADGIILYDDDNMKFTDNPDVGIDRFDFGSYYLGTSTLNAARKDEYVLFRNFKISTHPI